MEDLGKIALYTLCNDAYFETAAVMIFSFLLNNMWFNGDIIVLCDESLTGKNRFSLSALYGNLRFVDVDQSKYAKMLENCKEHGMNRIHPSLYYKFEVFKKDDYDVKVFLDADIVVNKDIKELFRNNSGQVFAVEDQAIRLCDYFNSGVLSIPGNAITEDFYDKLVSFTETFVETSFKNRGSGKGAWGDQDVLNELLENKRFIGVEYNYNPECYNGAVTLPYYDAKIIHYYGVEKPWNSVLSEKKSFLLWYKYFYLVTHARIKRQ